MHPTGERIRTRARWSIEAHLLERFANRRRHRSTALATEVTTRVVGARLDRRKRRSTNSYEIIDGAIELIEGRTVDELHLTVVSERVGVSLPSTYRHFHRMKDLLIAMTEHAITG